MKPTANRHTKLSTALLASVMTLSSSVALAFDSGSTGADGAFSPTVNTQLALPPDGIFNFTTVNIPTGVTVTFAKNATNTPVTILASGDVIIQGTIDVSGGSSADVGAAGDGNVGDDGLPGVGGPGGFDGGVAGLVGSNTRGSDGIGPGGGGGGLPGVFAPCGGVGGGFASQTGTPNQTQCSTQKPGQVYGVPELLPLIGGSGGGGGAAGTAFRGSGGGGGGGAVLIASSGMVSVSGSILANGGKAGDVSGAASGGSGGGGSGGAIRIIATSLQGDGQISAQKGGAGSTISSRSFASDASHGRIRLEAETITRTAGTQPAYSFSSPQEVFVAGLPGLRITSVAGVAAPANPTGNGDIVLPSSTVNPVTVEFETNGVPVGNTVSLTVTPLAADAITVISNALAGTEASATASVNVELPTGPSVFSASVSFTVTASLGNDMSRYAKGEQVEKIILAAGPHGSETTFVTVTGKQYSYPSFSAAF